MDNHVLCNNVVLYGPIPHCDQNEVIHGEIYFNHSQRLTEKWSERLVLLECSVIVTKEVSRIGEGEQEQFVVVPLGE